MQRDDGYEILCFLVKKGANGKIYKREFATKGFATQLMRGEVGEEKNKDVGKNLFQAYVDMYEICE